MITRKTWFSLKLAFAAAVVVLACYSLITENFSFSPMIMIGVGLMMIASGFESRTNKYKSYVPALMLVGVFSLIVGVYTWF